jgi:hypothetical protein
MSDNEKKENQEDKFEEASGNGEVFISQEYQDFKDAKDSFESDKQKANLKITFLQGEVAKAAKENLSLKNQLETEMNRRIKAENQVADSKNLSKGGFQTRYKTREEKFAEAYQKASEKLRNK